MQDIDTGKNRMDLEQYVNRFMWKNKGNQGQLMHELL